MFLKCLFSLRSPVRCCDWQKYAVELISCKTHQDFLLTVFYFISHLNIEACLEVNKAQWFMNLPSITHQSILPWLCTGTQSTLQMQNYRSWLCLHLVQPIHPYIQCHSWHTDVHSLRMHKVLDLLQLVYLKIDKKNQNFQVLKFLWVNSSHEEIPTLLEGNPGINLRNAEKCNPWELRSF